ncbi:hypothetical protein DRP07_09545 [Archaeoglobales archaeon]|nr:MAG: hypothetical protein DRP07_09545 [Archaeoglobales archaeon]
MKTTMIPQKTQKGRRVIGLDDDIINPKRFILMTLLFTLRQMTEAELSKASRIQWGSLSTHLKRLEDKGYVERKKVITTKGPRTVVKITEKGYTKYLEEVRKLKEIIRLTESREGHNEWESN